MRMPRLTSEYEDNLFRVLKPIHGSKVSVSSDGGGFFAIIESGGLIRSKANDDVVTTIIGISK
jgi:hypothetical protein